MLTRAGHQGKSLDLWAQHSRPSPASGTGGPRADAGHPPHPCNVTYTSATPVPQRVSLPLHLAPHVRRTSTQSCPHVFGRVPSIDFLWTRFGDAVSQETPAFSPGAGAGPQALCHCSSTRPGARYGVGLINKLSPHTGLHEEQGCSQHSTAVISRQASSLRQVLTIMLAYSVCTLSLP